jgi:hypothetical protein
MNSLSDKGEEKNLRGGRLVRICMRRLETEVLAMIHLPRRTHCPTTSQNFASGFAL